MRLIESSELNELNRVVIAIAELGGIRQACSVEAIMRLCASRALAGRPFDHRRILRVCNAGGLAVLEHRKVMLTEAGQEFLSLNAGGTYELTLAQRRFVSDRLVLLPNGKTWFVELKQPGAKPRMGQVRFHALLARLGHNTIVLDTKEKIDAWAGIGESWRAVL